MTLKELRAPRAKMPTSIPAIVEDIAEALFKAMPPPAPRAATGSRERAGKPLRRANDVRRKRRAETGPQRR
jgi:hypothetical protein